MVFSADWMFDEMFLCTLADCSTCCKRIKRDANKE
jgi:hypothetical protein